ncbi:MAG: hypothetical protein ABMB14_11250, partial [Myxococcota bacterium]
VVVPTAGTLPVGVGGDLALALGWGGTAVALALGAAPIVGEARRLAQGTGLAIAVATAGLVGLAASPSWTPEQPRRVSVLEDADADRLTVTARDGLPFPDSVVVVGSEIPAPAVSGTARDLGGGRHALTLDVGPGPATSMELVVRGGLASWSLGRVPSERPIHAYAVGLGDVGWHLSLVVPDDARLELVEYLADTRTPAIDRALAELAGDATGQALVTRRRAVDWLGWRPPCGP